MFQYARQHRTGFGPKVLRYKSSVNEYTSKEAIKALKALLQQRK
jgi:hypothetical protein